MNSHRDWVIQVRLPRRARRGLWCWSGLAPLLFAFALIASEARSQEVRVITREAQLGGVQLIEISDRSITIRTERGGLETIPMEECVGIINSSAALQARGSSAYAPLGLLVLADGQQLPGSPILGATAGSDVLYWRHRWLDRVAVPLDRAAWAAFRVTAQPPDAGEADVIVLINGDRAEGFITALRDPVEIEQDGRTTTIALDRISAIRLITPPAAPAPGAKRLWFDEGTVLDVPSISMGDDGNVHFVSPLGETSKGDFPMPLSRVVGILFDISAMVPLGSITAHDVEGPVTRYEVPAPEVDSAERALGLRDVTLRGPLTARYALPSRASRFMGTARLGEGLPDWPDCELVIAVDGRELFRERLSNDRRRLEFDVAIEGAELSIEVTEGAFGPIGDRVILEGAMIIVDSHTD